MYTGAIRIFSQGEGVPEYVLTNLFLSSFRMFFMGSPKIFKEGRETFP
jgi:hypothetical protein